MSIKRIEINIANNWRYGLVSFLVDRDDFLKDIDETRKKIGIKQLLNRDDVEEQFEKESTQETEKKYKSSTPEQQKTMRQIGIKLPGKKYIKYDGIALSIQDKYGKSNNFRNVIIFSILCGIVNDKDLEKSYPSIWATNPSLGRNDVPLHAPQIAIILDPETNPSDLFESYEQFIKKYSQLNKPLSYMWRFNKDLGDRKNIRRDREWYWKNKFDKGYVKLQKEELSKKNNISVKAIEKAIKRYKEMLENKDIG